MLNIYYNYSIINLLILYLYNLRYSTLYPNLTNEIMIFYFITIISSFILGFVFRNSFKYKDLKKKDKKIKMKIYTAVIIFVFDFMYGGIPLFQVLKGETGGYLFKGIPILHVLSIIYIGIFAIYIYHHYLSFKEKKYLFMTIICMIPGILMFSRGTLIYILISCSMLFFSKNKIKWKNKIKYIIILIFSLYLFGISGNIRQNYKYNNSKYIMNIGGATDEFRKNIIPKEFYWSYLYLTSSLANLQMEVNNSDVKKYNVKKLFKNSFMPNISKNKTKYKPIKEGLTVGTEYRNSYIYGGIKAMYIQFIYFILLKISILKLIKKSEYRLQGIVMINFMTIFSFFTNIYISVSSVIGVIFLIMGVILSKITIK